MRSVVAGVLAKRSTAAVLFRRSLAQLATTTVGRGLAGPPKPGETDDALKVPLRTASTSEAAATRMHAIFATDLTRVVASGPADPEEARSEPT
jgi:hypothetical protein